MGVRPGKAQEFDNALQTMLSPRYLLVIDCEFRRFTVDGPITAAQVSEWLDEASRASKAGRHIVCLALPGANPVEIQTMSDSLGYERWPSGTILLPPKPAAFEDRHRMVDGNCSARPDNRTDFARRNATRPTPP
jgi:hypothetical protein